MNKLYWTTVVVFFIWQYSECQTLTKVQLNISPDPAVYSHLEWADLDGDGDMDLAAFYSDPYNASYGFAKIYRNDQDVFTEVPNAFGVSSMDPYSYDFNDDDGDGDLDILILDYQAIKIARNNGNFSFTLETTDVANLGNWHIPIHWQDLDGDQDLDIVFDIYIRFNSGGTYSAGLYFMPFYTRNQSWADVNNDGLLDMVATKGQTHGINPLFLFINQGDGIFLETAQLSPGFRDQGQTQWLDADADDDLDLFITEGDGKCTLFRNTFSESGKAAFVLAWSFRAQDGAHADAGDVNFDGLPDIIINGKVHGGTKTYLYLNSSSGGEINFTERDLQISPDEVMNLDLADIDGDLDLDLFIFGWEDDWTRVQAKDIYTMDPGRVRPLPAIPVNPITHNEKDVTLQWDHGTDQGAVYFNMEIKRNGTPFKSALSLATGDLLMPDALNLQAAQHKVLRNLPAGNYEWRVQAVDHAARASGFSAYSAFTIAEAPTSLTQEALAYNKVKLDWTFSGTSSGFAILRRSSNRALAEIATVPAGVTTYVDTTVPPNERIEYMVKAIVNNSYSAPSNSVSHYSEQFTEEYFGFEGPNIISASGVSADFDHDQDYDLGFTGRIDYNFGNSVMLSNDGSGSYTPAPFLSAEESFSLGTVARDLDNDGDIDLCAITGSEYSRQKAVVYKKQGPGFIKAFESSAYLGVSQIAVEDLNYDGLPDLMFTHVIGNAAGNPSTYALLFQTPTGDFTDSKIVFLPEGGAYLGNFNLVDLTNDGLVDVLFLGTEYTRPKLFVNVNGNAFQETPVNFTSLTDPVFLDFNGDGRVDMIQRNFQALFLYTGLGDLQFSEPREIYVSGPGASAIAQASSADLDMNGWPDLILTDGYNTVLLYNTGHGNFVRADYPFASNWNSRIFFTDMEGDGDIDLVKQGNDSYHQGINYYYRNHSVSSPGQNPAPTVPTSLQAEHTRNATTLSWAPSTDNATPAELISYNLQLTDSSGKSWIHPETDASGVFRRRLAPGNAKCRTSFTINNLPAGHYTARVQAMDAAFKLSALSAALEFDIAAGPTALSLQRILLNKIKLTWTDGPSDGIVVVERKSSGMDFEVIAELPANSMEYVDEGLLYNKLYTYRVYEKNGPVTTATSNTAEWNTTILVLGKTNLTNIYGSLDVGDYTGDGKMDMLILGGRIFNSQTIDITNAVLENTGSGWLQQTAGSPTLPHTASSGFLDVNGDHRLDLYQRGYFYWENRYQTEVFLNNGDKTFSSTENIFTENDYSILGSWDYDRDNDLDLYVDLHRLLKNNGDGNFSQASDVDGCCDTQIIPADFDKDGDEDIFRYNGYGDGYTLLINSDGALLPNATIQSGGGGQLETVDYNGDGWPDLLFISVDNYYVKSKLYKNLGRDGSGQVQFQVVKDDLPIGEATTDWADYDHDGDLDLFVTGRQCRLYSNEGNDLFQAHATTKFSVRLNKTRWIDFDNDGDLDLYVTGYVDVDNQEGHDQPYSYVLYNQLIAEGKGTVNDPPAAPVNLASRQDVEGLHLTWDAQPDDHTPPEALTYDVVLYRNGKAIKKGPFNPVTGMRYKLAQGSSSGTLLADNLEVGNYTWKVQAIDQSFNGSVLSTAGQFTFRPRPPQMKDTVIYTCGRQVMLTAAGESIEWYSDEALTTKVGTGTYSPQTSQTVYVTQTINGLRGVARRVHITIRDRPAPPVILTPDPVVYCEYRAGEMFYLSASGEDVRWYRDAGKKDVISEEDQLPILLDQKTYYATQSIAHCESPAEEITVEPLIIDSRIFFSNTEVYTAERDGTYYQWFRNNLAIPGSNTYSIEAGEPDDVYAVYIQKGNCYESSGPTMITDIDAGIDNSVKIFPNPAAGDFTIQLLAIRHWTLQIHDVTGRMVYSATQDGASQDILLIPSAHWSSGMYLVTLTDGHSRLSRKVVITK